ncbi:MAG: hypothetical protein ABIB47_00445 [Candidatus Woesearchaeota archaeon]
MKRGKILFFIAFVCLIILTSYSPSIKSSEDDECIVPYFDANGKELGEVYVYQVNNVVFGRERATRFEFYPKVEIRGQEGGTYNFETYLGGTPAVVVIDDSVLDDCYVEEVQGSKEGQRSQVGTSNGCPSETPLLCEHPDSINRIKDGEDICCPTKRLNKYYQYCLSTNWGSNRKTVECVDIPCRSLDRIQCEEDPRCKLKDRVTPTSQPSTQPSGGDGGPIVDGGPINNGIVTAAAVFEENGFGCEGTLDSFGFQNQGADGDNGEGVGEVCEDRPQCSNTLDDDGDGLIDFCKVGSNLHCDPGCTGPLDNDESKEWEKPQCDDEKDNDGDGGIDWNGVIIYTGNVPKDGQCDGPEDDSEGCAEGKKECEDGSCILEEIIRPDAGDYILGVVCKEDCRPIDCYKARYGTTAPKVCLEKCEDGIHCPQEYVGNVCPREEEFSCPVGKKMCTYGDRQWCCPPEGQKSYKLCPGDPAHLGSLIRKPSEPQYVGACFKSYDFVDGGYATKKNKPATEKNW